MRKSAVARDAPSLPGPHVTYWTRDFPIRILIPMEGLPVRASDDDRDRVLNVLRERVVEGRLSQETFERRVDSALRARSHAELTALVSDLPPASRFVRGLTGAITS